MPTDKDAEKVLAIIQKILDEMKIGRTVESITYRPDYQDWRAILDNKTHCEFREKLVNILLEGRDEKDKEAKDALKEVQFRLNHPQEFEDWEDA